MGFNNQPISMSSSPADDQYKKFVVTCWRLKNSRADFPTRKKPGTRNAQVTASKIKNQTCRDDLLCPDIQRSCLSSLRAEEDLGQVYQPFPRICTGVIAVPRELRLC